MSKRKELPDHSIKAYSSSDPSIPPGFVERVTNQYGIASDFGLKEKLEFAWFWYNTLTSTEPHYPIAESRELLAALSSAAWLLHDCETKFGSRERRLLGTSFQHLIGREPPWSLLNESELLARAADHALASIPKSEGGSPTHAETALARHLYEIFKRGTGEDAPVSYSDLDDEHYADPVVDFVRECMAVMGIELTNSAVGKKLSRIRSAIRENKS